MKTKAGSASAEVLKTHIWIHNATSCSVHLHTSLSQSGSGSQTRLVWTNQNARSVAAAPAVPAPVSVSCRCLSVFGPPAQDLIGAVVTAATGHARRGLINLKL